MHTRRAARRAAGGGRCGERHERASFSRSTLPSVRPQEIQPWRVRATRPLFFETPNHPLECLAPRGFRRGRARRARRTRRRRLRADPAGASRRRRARRTAARRRRRLEGAHSRGPRSCVRVHRRLHAVGLRLRIGVRGRRRRHRRCGASAPRCAPIAASARPATSPCSTAASRWGRLCRWTQFIGFLEFFGLPRRISCEADWTWRAWSGPCGARPLARPAAWPNPRNSMRLNEPNGLKDPTNPMNSTNHRPSCRPESPSHVETCVPSTWRLRPLLPR